MLDEHVCTQVSERLRSIPPPRSFIVSGRLDQIKYGGGRFRLLLGRNDQLLGKLHPDLLDTEVLRPLWGNPTTVEVSTTLSYEPRHARQLAQRLEIHYTPKHGSWLNIAETN